MDARSPEELEKERSDQLVTELTAFLIARTEALKIYFDYDRLAFFQNAYDDFGELKETSDETAHDYNLLQLSGSISAKYFIIDSTEKQTQVIEFLTLMAKHHPEELTDLMFSDRNRMARDFFPVFLSTTAHFNEHAKSILDDARKIPAGIIVRIAFKDDAPELSLDNLRLLAAYIAESQNSLEIDLSAMSAIVNVNAAEPQTSGLKLICDALKTRKSTEVVSLNLGNCGITSENVSDVLDAIQNSSCKLHVDLSHNKHLRDTKDLQVPNPDDNNATITITSNGGKMLAAMIADGKCPANFSLDVSNCKFDEETLKEFANILKSPKCPKALQLDMTGNKFTPELVKDMAAIMLKNTKVTKLVIGPDIGEQQDRDLINFCVKRNKLLEKFPKFAPLILQMCQKNKLYEPGVEPKKVASLQSLAGAGLFAASRKGLVDVDTNNLPAEVQDLFKDIRDINSKLEKHHVIRP